MYLSTLEVFKQNKGVDALLLVFSVQKTTLHCCPKISAADQTKSKTEDVTQSLFVHL